MTYTSSLKSPIGILHFTYSDTLLLKIDFDLEKQKMHAETQIPLWLECKKQVNEYFAHQRNSFDLPYDLKGSDFQKKIWRQMAKIPYGKTKSYKNLAEKINNPNASRAVGNVCNKNPLPLVIPCHRVVYSNGKLGGFAVDLKIKENLLEFERNLS